MKNVVAGAFAVHGVTAGAGWVLMNDSEGTSGQILLFYVAILEKGDSCIHADFPRL